MKTVEKLDYFLINTREPNPEHLELCEKAYQFWHSSWIKTFNVLGVKEKHNLFADDFLDREVGVLTFENEPIGLFFNNWLDTSRDSILNHSYFKNYPDEVKHFIKNHSKKKVMVLTYMTLSEEWRKSKTEFPFSELLFSLGVKRFEYCEYDTLIGYIRKDQNTHEIFYRHGGQKISESTAYNVNVDFCILTKETMHLSSLSGVAQATDYLWEKMNNRQKLFKRRSSMHNVMNCFEDNMPRLERAFVNFPWENKAAYVEYLSQTYKYIQHSTKLLLFASTKTMDLELKNCFLHHIKEETGHENWAKNDLKNLGFTTDNITELDETIDLYNEIYLGIEKFGPAPIIGYAMALEGVSARKCPEIAMRLINKYGAKCSTLIKNHGDIDPEHLKDSHEVLRFFKDTELKIIEEFMTKSTDSYIKFLDTIATRNKHTNEQVAISI